MKNNSIMKNGFSIIELVFVILLLGILAVFILPKWFSSNSFEIITARDELLSRLRLVQTINMNEPPGDCTYLTVHSSQLSHATHQIPINIKCSINNFIEDTGSVFIDNNRQTNFSENILISLNNSRDFSIFFDKMGRPQGICQMSKACTIEITDGNETVNINIENEGYIHEVP